MTAAKENQSQQKTSEPAVYVSPEDHKKEFDAIIKKYNLSTEDASSRIADFLSSAATGPVTAEVFAEKFGMTPNEAFIFLSWINIGVQFKEKFLGSPEQHGISQKDLQGL